MCFIFELDLVIFYGGVLETVVNNFKVALLLCRTLSYCLDVCGSPQC